MFWGVWSGSGKPIEFPSRTSWNFSGPRSFPNENQTFIQECIHGHISYTWTLKWKLFFPTSCSSDNFGNAKIMIILIPRNHFHFIHSKNKVSRDTETSTFYKIAFGPFSSILLPQIFLACNLDSSSDFEDFLK